MEYKEFVEQTAQQLKEILPESLQGAAITTQQMDKLQGESYYGICITPEGSNRGVTLNLEVYFTEFERGMDYGRILHLIMVNVEQATRTPQFAYTEHLKNYSIMKECLALQAIPVAGNEKKLATIPHVQKEDIALVYRFVLEENERGMASTVVTNAALQLYGITPEQLHEDALAAAQKNRPVSIRSMKEILSEYLGEDIPMEENAMLVATCEGQQNGAGCLFYPDFMEQAAARVGRDFFILPSSIHEVILLPDDGCVTAQEMEEMVQMVNANQVAPGERLTNTVYHYDIKEKVFETAKAFEQRREDVKQKPEVQKVTAVAHSVHKHKKPSKNRDNAR